MRRKIWCYYHFKYLKIFIDSIYAYQDVADLSFYWFQTYDITLLTLKTCYVSILCDTGAFVYEIFFNSFLFFFQFFYRDFFFYVILWELVSLLVDSRIHRFRIFGEFWQLELINYFPCSRKEESTKNIPQQKKYLRNKIRQNQRIFIMDWNKTEICGFPWHFIVNGIPLIHEKKFARNRNGFCEMDFESEFTKGTKEGKKKENKL